VELPLPAVRFPRRDRSGNGSGLGESAGHPVKVGVSGAVNVNGCLNIDPLEPRV
jgi:hypothetical protein